MALVGRPSPITVTVACGDLVVHRWGDDDGRPAALLVHGTGFCGGVWAGVAAHLLDTFVVYALDRRGHGRSAKPADAYDFSDFAGDTVRVIDALGLGGAYGIGHSAGATDLLLASVERPAAFARLFTIEPTAMDPAAPVRRPERDEAHAAILGSIVRRTSRFASRAEVVERYRAREAFADWRPDLLEAYVAGGFHDLADGSVELSCAPVIERSMLSRIFAVMQGTYAGPAERPGSGNPLAALARVPVPTVIATTERSEAIYGAMAADARRVVPGCTAHHLDGAGHAAAQIDPDGVGMAVRRWWDTVDRLPGRTS